MKQLQTNDKKAHLWLLQHANSPRRWCKAFFPLTVKSDMLCNNLSESFNSFILEARDKSIITMLETIRKKLIRYRKIAMERKSSPVCSRIMTILDDHYTLSDNMEVEWNEGYCFEVRAYGHQYVVDCNKREYTCRLWQLTGTPCQHAINCLLELQQVLVDVVDECYSVAHFIQTYEHVLYPTTGMSFWHETNGVPLSPREYVKLAGRPKKLRRKALEKCYRKRRKMFYQKRAANIVEGQTIPREGETSNVGVCNSTPGTVTRKKKSRLRSTIQEHITIVNLFIARDDEGTKEPAPKKKRSRK